MAKWADFLISSVRLTQAGGHKFASHVLLHNDTGEGVGSGTVRTKDEVIGLLDSGKTVKTMRWAYPSWSEGALVQTITLEGVRYLRTHRDATTADNLDNMLPMDSLRA
jgi:hypothetical protein